MNTNASLDCDISTVSEKTYNWIRKEKIIRFILGGLYATASITCLVLAVINIVIGLLDGEIYDDFLGFILISLVFGGMTLTTFMKTKLLVLIAFALLFVSNLSSFVLEIIHTVNYEAVDSILNMIQYLFMFISFGIATCFVLKVINIKTNNKILFIKKLWYLPVICMIVSELFSIASNVTIAITYESLYPFISGLVNNSFLIILWSSYQLFRIIDPYNIESINERIKVQRSLDGKEQEPACSNRTKIETSLSNADELRKYKELLDMGAITEEEYAAKKKQLLNL